MIFIERTFQPITTLLFFLTPIYGVLIGIYLYECKYGYSLLKELCDENF